MEIRFFRHWLALVWLQSLIALVLFSPFISGQYFFAYLDIGSDSYAQFVPFAMNMARMLGREGFSGWSFETGLGGPTAWLMGDSFTLVSQLAGPGSVLSLRIWVFLLKLFMAGAAFLLLLRCYVDRWEAAIIGALAYSFCGFVVINGQWDPEATEFIYFPLILWAIVKQVSRGGLITVPLAIAAALLSGVFFVSVAVFVVGACLGLIAISSEPWTVLKTYFTKVLPLTFIGYLLAAPHLLPVILQMLDSSRVGGGQSLFQNILQQTFSINGGALVLAEIGGIFHKDIFGIGSNYQGYWNYLEGPGFYIGVTLFMLIPQLWNGTRTDRKVMMIGLLSVVAYVLFPVFRYAAMGFAAPYFRVSTLWVTLILLLLASKAVDRVLKNGVNGRLLAIGVGVYGLLLTLVVAGSMGAHVWKPHVIKILGLALFSTVMLLMAQRKIISTRLLPLALIGVVLIETVLIARPSFVEGRHIVSPATNAYDDGTLEALNDIRAMDKGVFRVEKTYHSVSLADSLAQDYMGVKSYSFNSRGVVDFNVGMGLIPPADAAPTVNYTNWLPNAGARFMLNTLLSVKYVISREALQWPGFVPVTQGPGYAIYRNDMALPLGVVQTKQVLQSSLRSLSALGKEDANGYRDLAIMNAVVLETPQPAYGELLDLDEITQSKVVSLQDRYFEPAQLLQATGLAIDQFSSNHIAGKIHPNRSGILVFSIPFNEGWSLKIDGEPTPMMRANFGMLAAPVGANARKVELDFRLPGQTVGFLLGAIGFGVLLLLSFFALQRGWVVNKLPAHRP